MISIIPAIDLIDGKCVRLTQGDYNQKKVYNENPLEVARIFEDAGIKRLHLVDLDGARTGHIVNHKILSQISLNTNLIVDYGGGIKSEKDIQTVFENGASMVTIGSLAVTNQQLLLKWLEQFGQERIIIGADVKDNHIAISGWLETTNTEIHTFVDFYLKQGAVNFLCTDISRDGMMTGTSNELYKELIEQHPSMHLIASGGVSSINDIPELERLGVHSVIIGKAFYEGLITINDLKKWIC